MNESDVAAILEAGASGEEHPLIVASRVRIRVAANALVIRGEDALLVEFSGGTPAAHFNFPGGGVDLGETLEEAIRREVLLWAGQRPSVGIELILMQASASARSWFGLGFRRSHIRPSTYSYTTRGGCSSLSAT